MPEREIRRPDPSVDPSKLLVYERSMFALAAAHALLFLLFGCLAAARIGSPPTRWLGLAVFGICGLLAWRRAWSIRRRRLLES